MSHSTESRFLEYEAEIPITSQDVTLILDRKRESRGNMENLHKNVHFKGFLTFIRTTTTTIRLSKGAKMSKQLSRCRDPREAKRPNQHSNHGSCPKPNEQQKRSARRNKKNSNELKSSSRRQSADLNSRIKHDLSLQPHDTPQLQRRLKTTAAAGTVIGTMEASLTMAALIPIISLGTGVPETTIFEKDALTIMRQRHQACFSKCRRRGC